jgi:hypothetical protein
MTASVTFHTARLQCGDCGESILAKSLYAHIVRRHLRYPHFGEVPWVYRPHPSCVRRLKAYLDRIQAAVALEDLIADN